MTPSTHPTMRFGGIQKNSFIDYPKKISAVLFFSGCNFKCPYCHNPALARGEFPTPLIEADAYAYLHARRGFLDAVVLSGGEPTLHDGDIFRICRNIKSMGYPIKLDTNGSRPGVLGRLIEENLIDYVAMDIKTDPEKYGPPLAPPGSGAAVLKSIDLLLSGKTPYEFRTTCATPFVSPSIMKRIGYWIKGAGAYFLQPFRPETTLAPDFFKGAAATALPDLESLRIAVAGLVPACRVR